MKKYKNILIVLIILLIGILVIPKFLNKKEVKQIDNKVEKKQFTIYKQKDDKSGYDIYDYDTFPDGYRLNNEMTVCLDNNGDTVSNIFTFNNGKFTVTSNKTVFCTLYFDFVPTLNRALAVSNPLVQEYKGEGWVGETNQADRFFTNHIYYWYVPSSSYNNHTATENAEIVRNSWNVVFAGHCWQIIRTTENGGVKLLYNGEPETTIVDGETQYDCSDNRNLYHMGGIESSYDGSYDINGTKVYADNYTATTSGNTTTFTLVNNDNSTPTSTSITAANASDVVGKYTCGNTSTTCTNGSLKKIIGISSGTTAIVYTSTGRDNIGVNRFNIKNDSLAYAGYMYNNLTQQFKNNFTLTENVINLGQSVTLNSTTLGWYFSDSYLSGTSAYSNCGASSNTEGNNTCYALDGTPVTGNSLVGSGNDYSQLVGKYTLKSNTSTTGTTSSISSIYYVVGYSGTSLYLLYLNQNHPLSYYQKTYHLSQTYENGSLQNSVQIKNFVTPSELQSAPNSWQNTWPLVYSTYNKYYVCSNGSDICTPWYITYLFSNFVYYYISGENIYNFSNTITYDSISGKYTIHMSNDSDVSLRDSNATTIWNFGLSTDYNKIGKAHYVCLDDTANHYPIVNSTECSNIGYVIYVKSSSLSSEIYYISLSGGKYVSTDESDAVKFKNSNNVLYDVRNGEMANSTDSIIKEKIDYWYVNNLLNTSYESFIDDKEIYCGDRSISNYGSWDLNANNMTSWLRFRGLGYKAVSINGSNVNVYNLSCPNKVDAYSKDATTQGNGLLTYSIGLISSPEMENIGYYNRNSVSGYWSMSPGSYLDEAKNYYIPYYGAISDVTVWAGNYIYVRPAIALTSDAEYSRGDGSMTNPYVVEVESN